MKSEPTSLEAFLFLLACLFILIVALFLKKKKGKHEDMESTIESDKRIQLQYELRRQTRTSGHIGIILAGILLGLLLLLALGK
jgi:Ca2+/Na+ antiporter